MSPLDEIRKSMGMPKEPGQGGTRQVGNNELPPSRIQADPNHVPPQMRHGVREVKIENTGRVIDVRQEALQRQQSQRLPDPARFIRESRDHNTFLRDGFLPPPEDNKR
jgi:hypothetical protein